MKHLQKYQAFAGDKHERVYKEQIVVGDQLSVERGTNAQFQLSNGFTPEQRFENLHFETADFHAEMKFMQVKNIDIDWSLKFVLAIHFFNFFQGLSCCNSVVVLISIEIES